MDRLRSTLAQYSHWQGLGMYVDRMEAHLETDFSLSVENAKALLEAIGKEICSAKGADLPSTPSINVVLKKAFSSLGYSSEDLVNRVSGSLASIGQEIGNLRNQISPTSHGKSLDELRDRNNKVDALTREFLIDSTLVVAIFLIRAFEERKDIVPQVVAAQPVEELLKYDELDYFNSMWDEAYGEFQMGDYSYTASEILFNVDYSAYKTEYSAHMLALEEELRELGEQQ